jgi:hypothetical protein
MIMWCIFPALVFFLFLFLFRLTFLFFLWRTIQYYRIDTTFTHSHSWLIIIVSQCLLAWLVELETRKPCGNTSAIYSHAKVDKTHHQCVYIRIKMQRWSDDLDAAAVIFYYYFYFFLYIYIILFTCQCYLYINIDLNKKTNQSYTGKLNKW